MTTHATPNQSTKPTAIIGWAYPSSPLAAELKRAKGGTYYLTIGTRTTAHDSIEQAATVAKEQGANLSTETIWWIERLAESIMRLAQ